MTKKNWEKQFDKYIWDEDVLKAWVTPEKLKQFIRQNFIPKSDYRKLQKENKYLKEQYIGEDFDLFTIDGTPVLQEIQRLKAENEHLKGQLEAFQEAYRTKSKAQRTSNYDDPHFIK